MRRRWARGVRWDDRCDASGCSSRPYSHWQLARAGGQPVTRGFARRSATGSVRRHPSARRAARSSRCSRRRCPGSRMREGRPNRHDSLRGAGPPRAHGAGLAPCRRLHHAARRIGDPGTPWPGGRRWPADCRRARRSSPAANGSRSPTCLTAVERAARESTSVQAAAARLAQARAVPAVSTPTVSQVAVGASVVASPIPRSAPSPRR